MSTSTPIAAIDQPDAQEGDRPAGNDPPVREVVVGVDGSECGIGAAKWAAQEAERRRAPLRIVHAAPYLSRRGHAGEPPPELARARRITAQAYTAAVHAAPTVRSDTEVVPGDPTTALLKAAAAGQLLVLGSSATGAADELVLASVAMKVAAHSPQPVVVVPRRRAEPAGRPAVAVLGVGERADDECVADFAAGEAQRLGVALSLLQTRAARHVVPDSWVDDAAEWERRYPGLEMRRTDLPGARANEVLGATCPCPLLAISVGHGDLLHRNLDGPHRWLLRHCTSPMALVPRVHRPEHDQRGEGAAVG